MGIRSKRSSHILSWERLVYNQGTEKMVLSYKGVGDPVLEVCRKNTSHILSWERPKRGIRQKKDLPCIAWKTWDLCKLHKNGFSEKEA